MSNTHKKLKEWFKKKHKDLDIVVTTQIIAMIHTLNFYLDKNSEMSWRGASMLAAKGAGCGM
jgi:zona occludens toxin (predicted ATPase)